MRYAIKARTRLSVSKIDKFGRISGADNRVGYSMVWHNLLRRTNDSIKTQSEAEARARSFSLGFLSVLRSLGLGLSVSPPKGKVGKHFYRSRNIQ